MSIPWYDGFIHGSRLRPTSRETYSNALKNFEEWRTVEAAGMDVRELRRQNVDRYRLWMVELGYSANTVNLYVRTLKNAFEWLEAEGVIDASPLRGYEITRGVDRAPEFPSVTELRALLGAAGGDRNWCIIALLAFSALKVSELLNCDVADLHLRDVGESSLNFRPASTQNRLAYTVLSPELVSRLKLYLQDRRRGPLILDGFGKRMTRHTAAFVVDGAAKRAGFTYKLSPQMLTTALQGYALEFGFPYPSVLQAVGVIQPRHAQRWLHLPAAVKTTHASVRIARIVLNTPGSDAEWLGHLDALTTDQEFPAAVAVMVAGATLERHLRSMCLENDLDVGDASESSGINKYAQMLLRNGLLSVTELHRVSALGRMRNDAAHGWFERIGPTDAEIATRDVRSILSAHPLRVDDASGDGPSSPT